MTRSKSLCSGGASHAFLRNGILVVIACDVAFDNLLLVVAPEQTVRAYAVLVLIAMLVAAWILLRRGKSKAAVTTVVVVGWCYITIVSFFFGGVSSTPIIMYPVAILLTGWLISTRAATVVAILSVVATFGLMLGEVWNVLLATFAPHPLMR